MRILLNVSILTAIALAAAVPAHAQSAAPTAAPSPASTAQSKYTVDDTDIGTLLDDPAAKAVVEQNLPGFTTNDQIEMARGMTLRTIQPYSPDVITEAKLTAIQAGLAKLPVSK